MNEPTSASEPTFEGKVINYLLAVISQNTRFHPDRKQPDWVPCRIRVHARAAVVLGLGTGRPGQPVETDCVTNVWGALFVERDGLAKSGVEVNECDILQMRPNMKKRKGTVE